MKTENSRQTDHPFVASPHRTLFSMSLPVLLSLIAEPLTGLVDTAFVARLGSESLAALGVGTVALSSIFWAFNFLGIGTQTEVAQAHGRRQQKRSTEIGGIAIYLLDETVSGALTWIWLITACWITLRAAFGVIRIWPGVGKSPLKNK